MASVDADALVIISGDGEEIEVTGRPWCFAQEQGFSTQVNGKLTLTGFYEGESEVGQINDATDGQAVTLRDQNRQPMWAGLRLSLTYPTIPEKPAVPNLRPYGFGRCYVFMCDSHTT